MSSRGGGSGNRGGFVQRGGGGGFGRGEGRGGPPRGGGGFDHGGGRGGPPRGGGGFDHGGGRGGPPRGGGGRGRSTLSNLDIILPLPVSKEAIRDAQLGWIRGELKPPPSKGVGGIRHKSIRLIVNNLESKIALPTSILHYDVDIDLDEDSKQRKKDRKDKSKDGPQPTGSGKSPQKGKGPPKGGPGDETASSDAPRPTLWRKLVLRTVFKIEQREQSIYETKKLTNPTKIATDGRKAMYTIHPIRCAQSPMRIPVKLKELDANETTEDGYTVTVTLVNVIPTDAFRIYINDMQGWLKTGQDVPADFATIDQIYNIVLKTPALRSHISVGRASFFPMPNNDGFNLGGGLVNWTGFSLTYTMGWKPFVTVDVANSAFLLGRPVLEVLKDLFGSPADNIYDWRRDVDFGQANDLLKTCQVTYVLVKNRAGQTLSRRVTGVSTEVARNLTFDSERGPTNVQEYFQTEKGMPMRYPDGPVLELGARSRVPAEFCTVTKGQAWRRKLNENQTAQMIRDTAKMPEQRLNTIKDAITLNNFGNQDVLHEFGISIPNQLLILKDARILPPPSLIYQRSAGQQVKLIPTNEGTWDMFDEKLKFVQPFNSGRVVNWTILNLARCSSQEVSAFVGELVNIGRSSGLELGNVENVMNNYEEMNLKAPFSRNLQNYFSRISRDLNFVLVIMQRKDTNIYASIKKAAELETKGGVLTQCIVGQNVSKNQRATVGNVLLKLNMKLGGVNNLLYIDHRMLTKIDVLRAPVMILGADVTHPGRDSKFPSLAAVTASIDRTGMPFQMHCQAQREAEKGAAEIIYNLDVIVKKMITTFIERTGHRPRKLIFYRDGVGDSQFEEVLQKEMKMLRKGCTDLANDSRIMGLAVKDLALGDKGLPYEPKITFIAVQKRHKTRFFPENPNDGVGRPRNAPPGTVVDTLIVNPNCTDFYLLSHIGIQGTSRPTRYQVLWDDSDFSIDEIQVLTYYLCYCYCRCNRSVSYPAPTYYAHLAATRAKIFTTGASDSELANIDLLNSKIKRQQDLLTVNPMHFV